MHNLSLNILATNIIFIDQVRITLKKLYVEFQPLPLKIFGVKWKTCKKMNKSCIIMLINPSSYNLLEQIVFDCQITLDRVPPV